MAHFGPLSSEPTVESYISTFSEMLRRDLWNSPWRWHVGLSLKTARNGTLVIQKEQLRAHAQSHRVRDVPPGNWRRSHKLYLRYSAKLNALLLRPRLFNVIEWALFAPVADRWALDAPVVEIDGHFARFPDYLDSIPTWPNRAA